MPGPLEYCMHRDGHLPAVATFIACQARMAEPFLSGFFKIWIMFNDNLIRGNLSLQIVEAVFVNG